VTGTRKTTATPKRPAKKAPARLKAPMSLDELDEQLRDIDPSVFDESGNIAPLDLDEREEAPEEHLFTLDGRRYMIPKEVPPILTMTFMREARDPRIGREYATERYLNAVLGEENLDALSKSRKVTAEDIAVIYTAVGRKAFGALKVIETAQGNS
jgi:hypothetical protein